VTFFGLRFGCAAGGPTECPWVDYVMSDGRKRFALVG